MQFSAHNMHDVRKTAILKVTLSLCNVTRTNEAIKCLKYVWYLYSIFCDPIKKFFYINREIDSMSFKKYSFKYINSNIIFLLQMDVNNKLFH